MTTTDPHDLVTSAGDDGTTHPAEQIWTPDQDPAVLGFTPVLGGLHITGLPGPDADDGDHPALFVLLGHHRWASVIHAAALYMQRVHAWTRWCLYPGDDPDEVIPRIPRAVHTHGVFLRRPHPDHGCASGRDDTWRMVWAPSTKPGAVPITAMRHPAATVTAAAIPNPDEGAPAIWAA
ncbi:hypothetical protein [Streptomyces rubiginosohelvolus]|uniref:hypothetical protein n=1 Tax=Streptomyces rubiginosohelvolus TaxID=67362 RepID=UPI0035DFA369